MKKLVFILFSLALITSCDNEPIDSELNNSNIEETGNTLSKLSVLYPSGNTIDIEFEEGYKRTNQYKNDVLVSKFEYDDQDRMTNFTEYSESSGEIDFSVTFNYNSSNEITSIDEYDRYQVFSNNNYTRTIEMIGNNTMSIALPSISGSDTEDITQYTFNNQGLLVNAKYIDDDGSERLNHTYAYDANNNCINLNTIAENIFTNSFEEYDFNYNFSDVKNPTKDFNTTYYKQLIIIFGRIDGFVYPLNTETIFLMGNNMKTTTILPSNYPAGAINNYFEFPLINQNNYPLTMESKIEGTDAVAATTTFEYTN